MDASCLKRADAVFNVELHPCKLHNVEEGVSEHLNALLFRFQEDLNGFVIAYKDVNIRKTKQTFIHPYFPLVHLEVRAKVLLFKPAEGCMLVGKVIKIAADFVGLLVLGVFNASIAADSIRSEFKCVDGSWTSKKDKDHVIEVGSEVRFKVTKLQDQSAFFGIFGSMMDKYTGAVTVLKEKGLLKASSCTVETKDATATKKSEMSKPAKKKMKMKLKVSTLQVVALESGHNAKGSENKKKKKKREDISPGEVKESKKQRKMGLSS